MPDHFRNFSEGYNDWLDRAEVFEAFAHGKMSAQDVQKWRAKKGHHSIDDVVPVLDQSGAFFKLLNPLNDSEKEKVLLPLQNFFLNTAGTLRKTFKFQVGENTLFSLKEMEDFSWQEDLPIRLPFERVFLEVKTKTRHPIVSGSRDFLFCFEQQNPISKQELIKNDTPTKFWDFFSKPFIVVKIACYGNPSHMVTKKGNSIYRPKKRKQLRFFPLYAHLSEEPVTNDDLKDFVYDKRINCIWLSMVDIPGHDLTDLYLSQPHNLCMVFGVMMRAFFKMLYLKQQGQAVQTTHGFKKPSEVTVRPPKKRKKHPLYEYHLLEIKPQVAPRSEPGIGDEPNGTRQRRHMVRGFYRTYKRPIRSGPNVGKTRVFVRSHARGDESLGYVKKDYVFANDENVVD